MSSIQGKSSGGLRAHTAHLSSPKPGEVYNGDAVLVRQDDERQQMMIAVIDGLGHGKDAAQAARAAVERLTLMSLGTTVLDAMRAVHQELRGSRGAAATLVMIDGFRLESCAVGNVQLMCVNCDVPLVLSGGILGHQVAKFRVATCEIKAGSRLALLSDGISTRFRLEELRHLDPKAACELVMQRHRRREDDATVLVTDLDAR